MLYDHMPWQCACASCPRTTCCGATRGATVGHPFPSCITSWMTVAAANPTLPTTIHKVHKHGHHMRCHPQSKMPAGCGCPCRMVTMAPTERTCPVAPTRRPVVLVGESVSGPRTRARMGTPAPDVPHVRTPAPGSRPKFHGSAQLTVESVPSVEGPQSADPPVFHPHCCPLHPDGKSSNS